MNKRTKLIIFSFLAVYIWSFIVYIRTPIKTYIVNFGELEDSINSSGYIIFKESLIYSETHGTIEEVAKEGEKISKGMKIATIYKEDIDSKIHENIKVLNERIADINRNQIQTDLFAGDLKKIEGLINNKANEIIDLSYNHQTSKISKIKDDINIIIEKRQVISGEKGSSGYNLDLLKQEKQKYEALINEKKTDLYSDIAGLLSFKIDGFEQILNGENIEKFTPKEFQELDNIKPKSLEQDDHQNPTAKIIDNFEWYISFIMDLKEAESISVGDNLGIRFRDIDNVETNCKVYYMSEEEKGKIVVTLILNKCIDLIYKTRKINFDIIKNSYSGFKVPLSAIRVKDGETGVYIVKDRIARFRELDILFKDSSFAIAKEDNTKNKNLLLYDEIIIKSNNDIEDGKIIR